VAGGGAAAAVELSSSRVRPCPVACLLGVAAAAAAVVAVACVMEVVAGEDPKQWQGWSLAKRQQQHNGRQQSA